MGKYASIGIDIGGTKTLCILVDQNLKVLAREKFKTAPADGKAKFSKRLVESTKHLAAEGKKRGVEVVGVGIASAGQVNPDEVVIDDSPNIVWLESFRIGQLFKKKLGLNSVIGNDVHLALCAEHEFGAAAGHDHVLGVFFGTGVGGAAVIHGKLYHGACGCGGRVGSSLAHAIGGAESLESHGTLDRIASKPAIAGAAIGMGVKQHAPNLYKEVETDISKVTWGALARARKAGDKEIDELIRSRLRVAGITLSSVVNFMNPEVLVLGGGLTEEMPRLVVQSVESGLREFLEPQVSRKLQVKAAKFGNKAGAIGAAQFAFKNLT